MNKVELHLIKPINEAESQEFTLSVNEDIKLGELTEYLRRQWQVLSDKNVYYSRAWGDRNYLNTGMTVGQVAQTQGGPATATLFVIDEILYKQAEKKKCCTIF